MHIAILIIVPIMGYTLKYVDRNYVALYTAIFILYIILYISILPGCSEYEHHSLSAVGCRR